MKYSELYDHDFVRRNYITLQPSELLKPYIEFYWESDYDLSLPPFSIQTLPRIGSTLLFNLKGQFRFNKNSVDFLNHDHIYYIRNHAIETTHQADSKIFGVQFRINLPLLCKGDRANEQKNIYPVKQLLGKELIHKIVFATSFEERVKELESFCINRITAKTEFRAQVVNSVLNNAVINIQAAENYKLSECIPYSRKTIERYFKECTCTTPKKAIQVSVTRAALFRQIQQRAGFNYTDYNFYDYSHFYRSIKKFKSGY